MSLGLAKQVSAIADHRLVDRVRKAITESGYSGLKTVSVTVHEETVILRGSVPSYFMKQIAQEVVKATCGVRRLSNRLSVSSEMNDSM